MFKLDLMFENDVLNKISNMIRILVINDFEKTSNFDRI